MKVSIGGVGVRVMLRAGSISHELPALWLRERSPEPGQREPNGGQRTFNAHMLPADLRIDVAVQTGDVLSVRFSDGHVADYDCEILRRQITALNVLPQRQAWRADLTPLPYHTFVRLGSSRGLGDALAHLLKYGFTVLTNVPAGADALITLAEMFGSVATTHVGSTFFVQASAPSAQTLRTQHPFQVPLNGYQFLHSQTSRCSVTLADSLAVVDRLGREDPEGLRLLATTPVNFRFTDSQRDLALTRPLIELDRNGSVISIFYHPWHDALPLISAAQTVLFHAARQRLAGLMTKDDFQLTIPMQPGHVVAFHNARILQLFQAGVDRDATVLSCAIDGHGPSSIYRTLQDRGVRPQDQLQKAPPVWKE